MATFDIAGFVSWFIITSTRADSGTFNEERFMEAMQATVVRRPSPAPYGSGSSWT